MPNDRSLRQIREARAELRALNRDLDRFSDRARTAGAKGGRGFGDRFKAAAVTGVKAMAKGAAEAVGETLMRRFLERGEKGGRAFGRGFKGAARREMESVSSSSSGGIPWGNLFKGAAIGAAAAGIIAGKALVSSLKEAMIEERLNLSFEALGDAPGGGGRLFEALRQDALKTGVEIEGMAGSVRKFLALGFDEAGALKLNRAILDVAQGLGLALSQVAAKGVAAMEEIRGQIAERGVPIFELLAGRLTGGDEAALIKMLSAGKVAAQDVIEAFSNLEGPLAKFRGGAERLGQTGEGLLGRMKQHAKDIQRIFSGEILQELEPMFEDVIGWMEGLKEQAKEFGAELAEGIGVIRAAFQELSATEIFQLAGLYLKEAFLAALDVLARGMMAIFASFQQSDFLNGLEDRMESAAIRFRSVMMSGVAEIMASLGDLPVIGEDFALAAARIKGVNIARTMQDSVALQRRMDDRGTANPWEILKEEFEKAPSMFGLTGDEEAFRAALEGRVRRRRERNREEQSREAAARPPADDGMTTRSKAPFDPGAVLGGGIANALSLISGGGSTVFLQRQVDLQGQMNRNQEKTNATLAQIERNTKPQPRRGPLKQRPKFA